MLWEPAHEAHAIERVSVTLQFAEQVPAKVWQAILNAATLDLPKGGFNARIDEAEVGPAPDIPGQIGRGILFSIGPGVIVSPPVIGVVPGSSLPVGRNFQIVEGSQVREEVAINRARFTYTAARYESWSLLRQRVNDLLGKYLDQALSAINLGLIKLEYWDRFVLTRPGGEIRYAELLRRDSGYVPQVFMDSRDLWHSHIGYFVPDATAAKRLVNLNIDVLDLSEMQTPPDAPLQRRSVGIYSLGQDALDGGDAVPETMDDTMATLDDLHIVLKQLIRDVITPEMADRIALGDRGSK